MSIRCPECRSTRTRLRTNTIGYVCDRCGATWVPQQYIDGWRAGREAAAKEIGCACQLGCPDTINCRRILVADIRSLPEPKLEDAP